MKTAKGNEKLGNNCLVVSRPVGLTCPTSCYFLGNGCYAEATEKRFPNTRKAGFDNLVVTVDDIKSVIEKALKQRAGIRIHERGDFGTIGNKIDEIYVSAWRNALSSFSVLPRIWFYTHFYDKLLSSLGVDFPQVQAYASVHNENDIKLAKVAGFTLFAYIVHDKKPKGGVINYPKIVNLPVIGNTVVCPEMRRGRTKVTCTGSKGTLACNLCTFTGNNVAFLSH